MKPTNTKYERSVRQKMLHRLQPNELACRDSGLEEPSRATVTERHESGRERTWGVCLVPASELKIHGGHYCWLATEPPPDLDYDYPPLIWNYRGERSKTPAEAREWLLRTYRSGEPGISGDGWTLTQAIVE